MADIDAINAAIILAVEGTVQRLKKDGFIQSAPQKTACCKCQNCNKNTGDKNTSRNFKSSGYGLNGYVRHVDEADKLLFRLFLFDELP